MRRREVDPELQHVHAAALTRETLLVIFLMEDARAGRHPLDVARADNAAGARAIVVRDASLERDRNRLEAAVGMRTDAAPKVLRRRIHERRVVVEQQERTQRTHEISIAREVPADAKAVADPVRAGRFVESLDAAHAEARKRGRSIGNHRELLFF